jgi:hypothetical protein
LGIEVVPPKSGADPPALVKPLTRIRQDKPWRGPATKP